MERDFIEEEIQQNLCLPWDNGKVINDEEKQLCQWVIIILLFNFPRMIPIWPVHGKDF